MEKADFVLFNGKKYYRCQSQRYFTTSYDYKNRKAGTRLHRDVWEFYSGKKIPKGFHIHHIDGNWLNNDYSNLECLSRKEHFERHRQQIEDIWKRPEMREANERGREACKIWHASEAGRKWHSEHQKKYIDTVLQPQICECCGVEYRTFTDGRKSTKCRKCRDREIHKLRRLQKREGLQSKS